MNQHLVCKKIYEVWRYNDLIQGHCLFDTHGSLNDAISFLENDTPLLASFIVEVSEQRTVMKL